MFRVFGVFVRKSDEISSKLTVVKVGESGSKSSVWSF